MAGSGKDRVRFPKGQSLAGILVSLLDLRIHPGLRSKSQRADCAVDGKAR